MRIAIIGAGAIGSYLAGRLAAVGSDVVVIARGRQRDAIAAEGVRITGQRPGHGRPRLSAGAREAGPCDLVVSCVKAFQIAGIVDDVRNLMGASGRWLCLINGVPWWYGAAAPPPLGDVEIAAVDPGRRIQHAIDRARVIGSVAYLRCEVTAPGVVDFTGGSGLVIGSVQGAATPLEPIASVLSKADIATKATDDVRSAAWNKLIGNVTLNPLSVVTGLTVDRMLSDPAHRATITAIVRETHRLMRALGHMPDSNPEARVRAMEPLGAFRTSTLQDADAGRPLEIDAIITAPVEIAALLGIDVPVMRALERQVRDHARRRGLLPNS